MNGLNLGLGNLLGSKKSGGTGLEQTNTAQHTATAAETSFTTVAATIPNNAVGMPIKLRAAGSVGGIVRIEYRSGQYFELTVAPNQAPIEYDIPAGTFVNNVGSVNVEFEAAAAGTLYGTVVWQVG